MMDKEKNNFKWRSFTSLYITISFLIIIVSGIVLYIAPPGRIAKWTYISILGFEKHQWQALHIIFTFSFIIASAFHLYFNWSPFISYLKDKFSKKYRIQRELFFAFLLTAGMFILVLGEISPFSNVIDFGERMKNTWTTKSAEPPVPHAEEMTVEQLATTIQISPEQLIRRLKEQGIEAGLTSVLKDLADAHDLSPNELFTMIELQRKSGNSESHQGKGSGRKTISQIAQESNIAISVALERLSAAGIEVDKNDIVRSVAAGSDNSPINIVNIIRGKKD